MTEIKEEPFKADYRKVAKNTIYLYIRMMLSMFVSLYTSRLIFQALGVEDYGVMNVVGGVLGLFTFFNGTLTSGTQRFMSIAIGRGDIEETKRVFSATLTIHVIIAIIVCTLTEIVGLYFIYNKLIIPADRLYAALWLFHLSVLSLLINLSQVPFDAMLIAREKMNVYAYMGIYNVSVSLIVALLITYINHFNKLILYCTFGFIGSLLGLIIIRTYCILNFQEARFRFGWDKKLYKEILNFSGWNIIGVMAYTGSQEGVNVLLNMFFTSVVNAARGISMQVSGWTTKFVGDFQAALNPQITKSFAVGNIADMWKLTKDGSKYSSFLVIILGLPIWLEVEPLLHLWLGEVPEHTIAFSRIVIIQSYIITLSRPLVTVVHATGRMKLPNLINGTVLLLIVPITYVLLRMGISPETAFVVNVFPWIFQIVAELYIVRYFTRINASEYWKEVIFKNILIILISFPLPTLVHFYWDEYGVIKSVTVICVSLLITAFNMYYFGIDKHLRDKIRNYITYKIPYIIVKILHK